MAQARKQRDLTNKYFQIITTHILHIELDYKTLEKTQLVLVIRD
jgi:hypothetical protein